MFKFVLDYGVLKKRRKKYDFYLCDVIVVMVINWIEAGIGFQNLNHW